MVTALQCRSSSVACISHAAVMSSLYVTFVILYQDGVKFPYQRQILDNTCCYQTQNTQKMRVNPHVLYKLIIFMRGPGSIE